MGFDGGAPAMTATLTVTRNGTATGTVSSSPAGIACGAACSAAMQPGATVTLTALPDLGAQFTGWSGGGCSGAAPTCTVTVADATSVTATFDVAEYLVTIATAGPGSGMVVAPTAGVACPGSCTAMIRHGSALTLTASPTASSLFMGWTLGGAGTPCAGTGPCTTTITGPTTITATFALDRSLVVMRTGTGTGTVTSNPVGILCGADCAETYAAGTSVTLTATPAADATFTGWSGGCSGTGPCTVVVNGAVMVTADFALRKYDLTVSRAGAGTGTVTSAPAAIDCGATCTAAYDAGTSVTLSASPAAGSTFAGWSGGGCTGTAACVVTMTAATSVTATFDPILYTLTVTRTGTGTGAIASSPPGITCGADCSEAYAQGSVVTLGATPGAGSLFTGWSGGGCTGTGTCTVTMAAATAVSADFALAPFALTVTRAGTGTGTVTSSPAGITCGTDCTEAYSNGTSVALTAGAAIGSTFTGWSGSGCTGTGTCTVTVNAAIAVTATFTLNTYTLTVAKAGTGSGTVTSSPAGISCGATCSDVVSHGTTVTLTAAPATGSTFTGWTGGGCTGTGTCTVVMTAATSVTAAFTLNTYALTVTLGAGTGSGSVASAPAGITCGSDCSEVYPHGTSVTLTATPAAGSAFSGWTGACSGTGPCTITMTAATVVTATFAIATFPVTVAIGGTGSGAVSSPAGISCPAGCSTTVSAGTAMTLTASPSPGSTFTGWSGGGCAGTGTCTFNGNAPTAVTATFTLSSYTLAE